MRFGEVKFRVCWRKRREGLESNNLSGSGRETGMIATYVGRWSKTHDDQLDLCARMEVLANRLPIHDVDALDEFALRLDTSICRIHAFEENDLFPLLESMSSQIRPLLVTFRTHHYKDRELAHDICQALQKASSMDQEALTNLKVRLGTFAEALRRHVEFEGAIALALFAAKRVEDIRAVQ